MGSTADAGLPIIDAKIGPSFVCIEKHVKIDSWTAWRSYHKYPSGDIKYTIPLGCFLGSEFELQFHPHREIRIPASELKICVSAYLNFSKNGKVPLLMSDLAMQIVNAEGPGGPDATHAEPKTPESVLTQGLHGVGGRHGIDNLQLRSNLEGVTSFVIKVSFKLWYVKKSGRSFQQAVTTRSREDDVGRLLKNEKDAIIRIIDQDKKTVCEKACHSSVLASNSEVFSNMFSSKLKESKTKVIELPDSDVTESALTSFLYFLQWGTLDPSCHDTETLETILGLADKYAVPSLGAAASAKLTSKITVENCAHFLTVAQFFNCQYLKKAVVDFWYSSLETQEAIKQTEGFEKLDADCLELLGEL